MISVKYWLGYKSKGHEVRISYSSTCGVQKNPKMKMSRKDGFSDVSARFASAWYVKGQFITNPQTFLSLNLHEMNKRYKYDII